MKRPFRTDIDWLGVVVVVGIGAAIIIGLVVVALVASPP